MMFVSLWLMVGWQINDDQLFLEVGMKMSSNYKDILD